MAEHNGELRRAITKHFNAQELRTLCFDLGLDYDNLEGEGKIAKVRELVSYHNRRGIRDRLIAEAMHRRPNQPCWMQLATRNVQGTGTGRILLIQQARQDQEIELVKATFGREMGRVNTTLRRVQAMVAVSLTANGMLFLRELVGSVTK